MTGLRMLGIATLSVVGMTVAFAQPDSLNFSDTRVNVINADVAGALVYVDETFRGVVPLAIDSLPTGRHHIRVIDPDFSNWLTSIVEDTIDITENSQTFSYRIPRLVMINSDPSGANVMLGDSLLGQTPFVIDVSERVELSHIMLTKVGYSTTVLGSLVAKRGTFFATLQREWEPGIGDMVVASAPLGGRHPHATSLYITGAAAVLSGVASAYFKTRADREYDAFLFSGDQTRLSTTRRLDTSAGIALVATQVSIFLFVYFLLSD
ncbi:MAG TPA: PEGA domain-containing protein [Bacteroidota bacterium]